MTIFDRRIEEASMAATLLHDLDTGNTNQIRYLLQAQMGLAMFHVDSLLNVSDARSRDLARGVALQIAEYRAKGSVSFSEKISNWDDETVANFDALLKRAASQNTK